jgi:cobalt-zinc-cadmium efflux system outer membrane protein
MERDITAAGIRSARELSNPSVSFSATRDEPHESLFFDEPIEIAGQRGRRIDVAQQEARLTDLQISTLERQIRRQVREAFYGAALALAKTAQRVEARDLATRLRDIAQARFQAGDVPQLEVFQAELEVSRADAAYQVAGEEEKIAWSQLDVLLGEAPETVWEIQGSLEDETSPMTLDQLLARAGQSSPELQNLAQELEVEDKKEALLSADRVPDLVLEGGVDFNSPHDFKVGARGQVTMDVPLFSRNQGEIAEALATAREMETELLATRRSVNARVEQAYFEFEARRTEIDLDRTTLLPAGRHLESLAEDSYKAGKSDILSVLDAQRDVQQLEGDYLDNLFAFQSAFAELEEAVGEPLN